MISYEYFNVMDADELTKLDGIGKLVAKRIILNRPFRTNKDLLKIKGLGKQTLTKLGIVLSTRAKKDKTEYFMDNVLVDVSTRAYAKNTNTGKVDYFWRIPREYRQYLG